MEAMVTWSQESRPDLRSDYHDFAKPTSNSCESHDGAAELNNTRRAVQQYIYENKQVIKDAKKMVSGAEGVVPKILLDKFDGSKS